MSVSENSTLFPQVLEGTSYGRADLAVNSYDKSPYTDPDFVSLDVGPSQTRFRVHRVILSQSPELEVKPFSKLWGDKTNDTIALPDLDEATAHTLVHYLYSAKYQSLQSYEVSKTGTVAEYKLSACVYCAAIRYKLSGLAELAKERIISSGEDLTILDVLGVAREHAFPRLPEDETWFSAYLERAIKGAAAKDPMLFTKPDFVDLLEGDRRFRQVVMMAIVNSYSRGPEGESKQHVEMASPDAKQANVEDDSVAGEIGNGYPQAAEPKETPTSILASTALEPELKHEPVVQRNVQEIPREIAPQAKVPVASKVGAQNQTQPEALQQMVKEDEVKFDAIEPTPPPPKVEPEPYTDELGFGTSKTYQKLGKKADPPAHGATPTPAPAPVPDPVSAPAPAPAPVSAQAPIPSAVPASHAAPVSAPTPAPETKTRGPPSSHTRSDSVMQVTETLTPTPTPAAKEKKTTTTDTPTPVANNKDVPSLTTTTTIADPVPETSPLVVNGTDSPTTPSSKKSKKNKKKKAVAAAAPSVSA